MRVLMCGGRDYDRYSVARTVLYALDPQAVTVVHGGASGADRLAGAAASGFGFDVEVYPADWNQYGKAAGGIRNQQMLDTGIDLVVAFPGGRGTDDMKRRARAAGVPVLEVS